MCIWKWIIVICTWTGSDRLELNRSSCDSPSLAIFVWTFLWTKYSKLSKPFFYFIISYDTQFTLNSKVTILLVVNCQKGHHLRTQGVGIFQVFLFDSVYFVNILVFVFAFWLVRSCINVSSSLQSNGSRVTSLLNCSIVCSISVNGNKPTDNHHHHHHHCHGHHLGIISTIIIIIIVMVIISAAAYIPTIGTSAQRATGPTAVGATQCYTTHIALHCLALHFITTMHCIALFKAACIAFHCIALPQCYTTHIA